MWSRSVHLIRASRRVRTSIRQPLGNVLRWNSSAGGASVAGGAASEACSLNGFLDVHNHETRNTLKELFRDDLFIPKYNQTLDEERETAYQRLKAVCNTNCVSVKVKLVLNIDSVDLSLVAIIIHICVSIYLLYRYMFCIDLICSISCISLQLFRTS